ncbi:MAG TPA: hypothetical protein VGK94_03645 [Candidatus Polarisedimenticolia bacterium]
MSGLDKEFPGKARGLNVDCTTPEAVAAIKELGFRSHGIVIRDGAGKALWKQPDHQVNMDDVRKALKELTDKPAAR